MTRDLLVRLQESRITLNILQKTGIGKTVNNLRRLITNEDISGVAKSLLKNWKKLVPGQWRSLSLVSRAIDRFPSRELFAALGERRETHRADDWQWPIVSGRKPHSPEDHRNEQIIRPADLADGRLEHPRRSEVRVCREIDCLF